MRVADTAVDGARKHEVEATVASLDKMVSKASERLEPGEVVIVSVLGISKRLSTDAEFQKPAVLMATDRRVMLYAKDLMGQAFESYRYGDITSTMIMNGKALQGGEATFSVAGNAASVYRIRKGDLELFERTVREHMESAKSNGGAQQPSAQAVGIPEQINQIAALHDQGILTDEEYAAKKQELLARM